MQKQTLALLAGAMLVAFGGAFALPTLLGTDETPIVRWDAKDEQDVPDPAEPEAGSTTTEANIERTSVELAAGAGLSGDDTRVEVTLRGRVVDKFQGPVPGATVWLDFSRGGQRGGPAARQRRVPDPVQTDREGRFAFQGQVFRNLRVSLQVASKKHAPGLFEKDNLGQVAAEMDLGDLVLTNGGEVIGRVTDLEGNGIAAAAIDLGPENGNRMRMVRDRSNLIGKVVTDNNGYFRALHVAAGDWSASATAKKHTEGRSSTFAVEEDQATEIEDIRLGPGFEVTGYVRTTQGLPIAKAEVTLQSQGQRNRGPGGGPGGGFDWRNGGRDHAATTDEQGRFFLEHLPGVPMRVEARADGYLDHAQDGVDITLGQPLQITLQDGLRIAGVATDAVDAQLVTSFAVRAVRVRGLPVPGQANVDFAALMSQMRDPNLDEAQRQQLRAQIEAARASLGDARRGGPGGGPGRGGDRGEEPRPGGLRDLGKPESHPDGAFVVTGLQEGVYEVHVQSPDHARFRSAEVEVRLGAPAPTIAANLDRGVYVAGIVRNDKGLPVQGARVEVRTASANEGAGGPGRRGRGAQANAPGNGANNGPDLNAMGRDMLRQAAGVQLTLEATTDAEGEFIVKHAPRGTYRAQAEAKGFATATSPVFELQADKSGLELEVGSLGAIAGHVRGLASKEYAEARVAAVPIGGNGGGPGGMMRGGRGQGGGPGNGPFNSVTVQADGTYRIADLAPGDYVVRSWIGSPQELMRELGPQFFSGTLAADAKVRGGETTELDVAVVRPAVGEVAGTVLHNGTPATGFQVELTRIDDTGAAAAADPRGGGRGPGMGGRGGMFGGGRSFQAAVASSGRFSIKDVPAGNYRLRVNAARRGGALHEETIEVAADATAERNIQVATASLVGAVTADSTDPSSLSGSVSLLPGLTELPENWNQWRRDPGNQTFDARVQNGAFKFDTLKPGTYLLVLSIRGRERASQPIVVAAGSGQQVAIAAGKIQAVQNPGGNGAVQPNAPGGGRPR